MSDYFNNTDWKAQRLGKFTASEIWKLTKGGRKKDVLFGDTAMTYIREKVAEIITGEAKQLDGLKALEWGAANELDAITLFSQELGEPVEHFGVGNPEFFPWSAIAGGSPDGLTETAVVEVKCPWVSANHIEFLLAAAQNVDEHGAWLADNHEDYYCQVQFNMLCTGRRIAFLVSYDPRAINHKHRLAILHISRDESLLEDITSRLEVAKGIIRDALGTLEPEESLVLENPVI
jgi:hypothetical protein